MDDFGLRVQRKAELHVAECEDAMDRRNMGEEVTDDPASAPYCGCITCTVREVLYVAYEELLTAAEKDAVRHRDALYAIATGDVPNVTFAEPDLISEFARRALDG